MIDPACNEYNTLWYQVKSIISGKKLSFPMISSTRVRELIADDIVRGFEIFEFDSAEDFTQYQQAIAAPVIAMLANETKSRQEEIWNKVTEAAKSILAK